MSQIRAEIVSTTDASALKRQFESRWKTLDSFESSVKKLDLTRLQWKQKYAMKEGELEAVKVSSSGQTGYSIDDSLATSNSLNNCPESRPARHPTTPRRSDL